jgi:hypothetical protein
MAVQRLNLTRDQLASFLQDFEQIKQFERLFATVDTINTVTLDEINVSAGSAFAAANEALAQISALSSQTDFLAFAPPDLGGTVTSVGLSGGTTGITIATSTTNPITTSGTFTLGGTLVAVNGGTGLSSYTVGDILFASTATALSRLADVATGNALISGGVGVAPSYGKIGLTTHVSGTLPIANGGTNNTATPTAGGVAYGTGTSYAVNAAGPAGYVLTSGGAAPPVWTPVASLAVGTDAYWGSFWDTTTQTAATINTAYTLTLNTADVENNGVTIVSGSRVTFIHAGVYSLTFSVQLTNTDNSNNAHIANIWIRKNGANVTATDSKFTVPGKFGSTQGAIIGTVNFVLPLAASDYIELVWSTTDTSVAVTSFPAGTTPVTPVVPSIIFTAVAAAPVGLGYAGVESFTSLTVGTGSKTFTVNTNATDTAFIVGNRVRLVNSSVNYMDGVITAYSGTSMTVLVDGTAGSGTYTAWFVTLTGSVGGVTSASVISANGFAGTVATATTTPAITLTTTVTGVVKGNGTAISAATKDVDYFAPSPPVTQTADFTVGVNENWVINNKTGSTCTVTLPAAASYSGRCITFQNYQDQSLVSASSNVVPRAGGAAGTAILDAVSGNWATLVSNGTNWVIMQAAAFNNLLF